MTYRVLIFDFDGTLADTFPWFASILNDVADRYGFRRVGESDVARLRSLDARSVMDELGVPLWKAPMIARHLRALASRDAATLRPFPGVRETLAALARQGYTIAVVSSNAETTIRTVLGPETAGLIARFSCGVSLFGKAKKLRRLVRDLRVSPREALLIGDEIRDADAARNAGIDFGAVAWGYTAPEALARAKPTLTFDTVDAIEKVLTSGLRGETDGFIHASLL